MASERGAIKSGSIANGGTTSAEVDLGDVFKDVTVMLTAAEAGQLGAASTNALHASKTSGGDFKPVFNEGLSAVASFTKPASGGVQVTYYNVNARYIKLVSSGATTAQVDFTAQGIHKLEYTPPLERATIP